VLNDVKDGDLIFSIAEPLISVVSRARIHSLSLSLSHLQVGNTKKGLSKTCDNCFACERTEEGTELVLRNVRRKVAFEACDKCGVVYYCNEVSFFLISQDHYASSTIFVAPANVSLQRNVRRPPGSTIISSSAILYYNFN
jgi:hypothetical protein